VWSGGAHFEQNLNVDLNSSDAPTVFKMVHGAFIIIIIFGLFFYVGHCQEPLYLKKQVRSWQSAEHSHTHSCNRWTFPLLFGNFRHQAYSGERVLTCQPKPNKIYLN